MAIIEQNDTFSYVASDGRADEARLVGMMPVPELLSGSEGYRRLRVDSGEPAFFEGRQFRIAYEFNFASTASVTIEAVIGVNTILTKSNLEVDQGGVRYSLTAGGTPSGVFGTPITVLAKNGMTGTPAYTSQLTFNAGGSVTGGVNFPITRVRTASANGQRSSAVSGDDDARGFAPTTLHLLLEPLNGINDSCRGILNLEWEERP